MDRGTDPNAQQWQWMLIMGAASGKRTAGLIGKETQIILSLTESTARQSRNQTVSWVGID